MTNVMQTAVRLSAALFLILTAIVLLVDMRTVAQTVSGISDKVAHAVLFGGVAVSLAALLPRWPAPALLVLTLGLAAASEGLQALVGRRASVGDFIADAVGASLVVGFAMLVGLENPFTPRGPGPSV